MHNQLHRAQVTALETLRHAETARFSTLMRSTGLESDTFKFHLRKLVQSDYVEKTDDGRYQLTAKGKEFANNLDDEKRSVQRQPKLSIMLLVPRLGATGERQFLFQKRLRNPYYGFWSCIGGPIRWGEDAKDAAKRELKKQTGLVATCTVRSFYRQRDYAKDSELLLEDKLFIILEATDVQGDLDNSWYGGDNEWMTVDDLRCQQGYFVSVVDAVEMLDSNTPYASTKTHYDAEEY